MAFDLANAVPVTDGLPTPGRRNWRPVDPFAGLDLNGSPAAPTAGTPSTAALTAPARIDPFAGLDLGAANGLPRHRQSDQNLGSRQSSGFNIANAVPVTDGAAPIGPVTLESLAAASPQPNNAGSVTLDSLAAAAPQPGPAAPAPSTFGSQVGNAVDAFFHHAGSALHGTAQLIEHGLAKGTDLIDPNYSSNGLSSLVTGQPRRSGWNQSFQNIVAADDAALAKREADYQASVPDTAGAYAGAAAGEVLPWLVGGVPRGLAALGEGAANLASKGISALPYVPTVLSRLTPRLASGAAQGAAIGATAPVTAGGDYWANKGSQVGTGATFGGAVPAAGAVASGVKNAAGWALPKVLGGPTGVGPNAISAAYQAGKAGDTAFTANMRGQVPIDAVLDDARTGLAQMRADRAAAYRNGMLDISADKSVLDLTPVQKAVSDLQSSDLGGLYKGKVLNQAAADTTKQLADTVNDWASSDPAQFHTPEGFDALKQAIGGIREQTQPNTQARLAVDRVYNSVKQQITAQAPTYAKVMGDYSAASDAINEVQSALSLGEKAKADTAMRKLQSALRNDSRMQAVNTLQNRGGVSLVPSLAGQAMSSWTPRGLVGSLEQGAGPLAVILHPAAIPKLLAAAVFTSPRIVGESAYGLGRLAGGVNSLSGVAARNPVLPAALRSAMLSSATGPSFRTPQTIPQVYGQP